MIKKVASNEMDKIVSLCKRRGFIFPGSEIYGGLQNSWDYGPLGVELKRNITNRWWQMFVRDRDDMVGLDAALLMSTVVWEHSGHLKKFQDPLVECKNCHERFRADELTSKTCPVCDKDQLTSPRAFNLMLKTHLGPAEDAAQEVYFRPETAQGIFVNFKNVVDTTQMKLPFGIAQIGKAFRNEITPGNFIFRTREFEQMEIEYFIEAKDWKKHFKDWQQAMRDWIKLLGIDLKDIVEVDVPKSERAHYSEKTIDFEYKFPFGQKELYGLAYRGDYDLTNHGLDYLADDPSTSLRTGGQRLVPHVIEPSLGVDRTVLTVLCSAYHEEKVTTSAEALAKAETRVVLKLPAWLAPVKVAVFPLLKNKPALVTKAREIYNELKKHFACEFDDNGNVGKRYRRQDEIGTPYCITVDFDTLDNDTVTVRDRDTMQQERLAIANLTDWLKNYLEK